MKGNRRQSGSEIREESLRGEKRKAGRKESKRKKRRGKGRLELRRVEETRDEVG